MDWKKEAEAVIADVKSCVAHICLSEGQPNPKNEIFMNLTILEGDEFTVQLTVAGFRIVGNKHESIDPGMQTRFYETPYALLNEISKKFNEVFSERLSQRLLEEAAKQED